MTYIEYENFKRNLEEQQIEKLIEVVDKSNKNGGEDFNKKSEFNFIVEYLKEKYNLSILETSITPMIINKNRLIIVMKFFVEDISKLDDLSIKNIMEKFVAESAKLEVGQIMEFERILDDFDMLNKASTPKIYNFTINIKNKTPDEVFSFFFEEKKA